MIKKFVSGVLLSLIVLTGCSVGDYESSSVPNVYDKADVLTTEQEQELSDMIGDEDIVISTEPRESKDGETVIYSDESTKTVNVDSPDISDMDSEMYSTSYEDSPFDALLTVLEDFT